MMSYQVHFRERRALYLGSAELGTSLNFPLVRFGCTFLELFFVTIFNFDSTLV